MGALVEIRANEYPLSIQKKPVALKAFFTKFKIYFLFLKRQNIYLLFFFSQEART